MINNEPNSNRDLLERIAADDRDAFASLYTFLYPRLFRYLLVASRSETVAEEILQDVFVKLWIKRHTLVGIKSLESFMLRMVKNRLIDTIRKRDRIISMNEQALDNEISSDNIFQDVLLKEYHDLARKAIDAMPERRRKIFLLNAEEELTAKEIADRMQLSLTTVKKQLYEANHFIRNFLNTHGDILLILLCYTLHLTGPF
ncbi:RNA polymerase sigma factor [Chitinophaga tropicalis]|uniref:RNA polymerase sigma factor n=1 Tax=Chitinophaga tropicalis TaxID=2683588 RepID=UPI0012FBE7FB|nr:RNA polymerase sigma-70 factor [Chitinophaga tropicalis]